MFKKNSTIRLFSFSLSLCDLSVRCLCSEDQSGLSRVNVCVAGGSNSVGEHQRVRLPTRSAVLAFLGAVRQGRCQVPLPLLAQERVSSFTQVCICTCAHVVYPERLKSNRDSETVQ
jgi:hypothetical protein